MVLRATNTGATAIIDPHGNLIAQAPHFTQFALNGMAQGYGGTTPYVRWGNWLFLGVCLIIILFLVRTKLNTRVKSLSKGLVSKHKTK